MKPPRRKKYLISLLVFLTLTVMIIPACPKTPTPPDSIKSVAELETYLEALVNHGTPPGLTLVVVKNDSIIYSKGFGWADEPRKIQATPQTVYHWYSITKIATAMAILQLQDQGKLRLDDSVTKFLPFFKVKYPSAKSRTITIRNLLNHSSGLPDPGFRKMRWIHYEGDSPVNQTELVKRMLPKFSKLAFKPGNYAAYTNFGYMVLGAIIEKVTNQTYEDYIRQHIMKPLEMKHTDFLYTKAMEPFEAAGAHPVFNITTLLVPFVKGSVVREKSGNHLWLNRFYNDQTPSTGLIGSVTDAAHMAIAYMNNGEFNGQYIISAQSIDTMTYENHIKMKHDPTTYFARQGIGWQIYKDKRGLTLQHTGGGPGFSTIMQLYPGDKLGFILFANDSKLVGWKIIRLAATLKW